jgi:four helix bundle protein
MMPYEKFEAWHLCHKLSLAVYRETTTFPASERYGLTSQARRAAFSAAANIAEGAMKHGVREFRRYLDISLGSLSELSYTLLLARDLKYLSKKEYEEINALRDHAGRVTWGLYRSMGHRKTQKGER